MKQIRIDVTQEDIDKAREEATTSLKTLARICPISQAVKRIIPSFNSVITTSIGIMCKNTKTGAFMQTRSMPAIAISLMNRFDAFPYSVKVKPISFVANFEEKPMLLN